MLVLENILKKNLTAHSFPGDDELPQASACAPGVQTHPRPSGQLSQLPGVNLRGLLPVPW